MLDELADPLRVLDVGLATRDVAQVVRVEQPALEPILERLEHRLPIHAGGLHPDQRHTGLGQPAGELREPGERRLERLRLLVPLATTAARHADGRHDVVAMHVKTRAPLYDHIHSSAPFGRQLDPVARRGPPTDESVLRARSSNQRSHRSPRHAVARALTHQASPASIRAQGFSPLTGGRRAGPRRCRTNLGAARFVVARSHRTDPPRVRVLEKRENESRFSRTLRKIRIQRRVALRPVVCSSQLPRFARRPRGIAQAGSAACPTVRRRESNRAPGAGPPRSA